MLVKEACCDLCISTEIQACYPKETQENLNVGLFLGLVLFLVIHYSIELKAKYDFVYGRDFYISENFQH